MEVFFEPPSGWDPWQATYSPDKQKLAFYGWDPAYQPRIALIEGKKVVPVTPDGVWPLDFAWMPGSDSIIVSYYGSKKSIDLGIFDLSGNQVGRIRPRPALATDNTGMIMQPEGDKVLLAAMAPGIVERPTDLIEVDIETGDWVNLTGTRQISEEWPALAPNGDVLFTSRILSGEGHSGESWVARLDLKSGDTQRITARGGDVDTAIPFGAHEVLFATTPFRSPGLWRASIEGDALPRQVTSASVRWPSAGPRDGTALVKVVGSPGEPGGLALIEP